MITASAALLAGGKSTRMGRDKCLLEVNGVPLWKRQLALLQDIASEVSVVAPSRPEWCPSEVHWVRDIALDHGPLAGVSAALGSASHARVVLLAIDLPAMNADFLQRLLMESSGSRGAVPVVDGLYQPFSAVYPRTAADAAMAHLAQPDKSLQRLIRQLVAAGAMREAPVAKDDLALFRNWNFAAD